MIVLENKIYVYNFHTRELEVKFETISNPKGLCAINGSKDMFVLAVPSNKNGEIQVTHFDQNNKTFLVQSHLGDVTAVALNHEGTLLATASNKGLVIRIFNAENGQLIQELRRGTDRADIYSLTFDLVSKYIGVSSDKGTIHLFTVRKDVSLEAMSHK